MDTYAKSYIGYEIVGKNTRNRQKFANSIDGDRERVNQLHKETKQIGEYKHDINAAHAYKLDLAA